MKITLILTTIGAAAGFAYVTTADTVITATVAGATATGQIELVVYYMID